MSSSSAKNWSYMFVILTLNIYVPIRKENAVIIFYVDTNTNQDKLKP